MEMENIMSTIDERLYGVVTKNTTLGPGYLYVNPSPMICQLHDTGQLHNYSKIKKAGLRQKDACSPNATEVLKIFADLGYSLCSCMVQCC